MILFGRNKLDPIIKLKLKEKGEKEVPVIVISKTPFSNKLKNSISKNGEKLKYEYKHMNAIAGQLTLDTIDRLSELPEVSYISYDRKANICMDRAGFYVGAEVSSQYSLTGKGVVTAVIDTGVYPHGDLTRPYRVVTYFKDFIGSYDLPYDDNGHGTHTCGVIAGSGSMCEGRFKGIAPGSRIIMLKAFNSVGEGSFSTILSAIEWVLENKDKYGIKILCLPFGSDAIVSPEADPLCRACRISWNSGLIVIAAAGNKGPYQGTITTPGIEPSIITAGCCECKSINIRDWKIADFSGRGGRKTSVVKPELIAPGIDITSLSSDKSYIPAHGKMNMVQCLQNPYAQMSGTSVSTAITAGCISLLLEKMPNLSGNDLKGILKLSCLTLNESNTAQGYGVINIKKLIN
jgi:Subtilisin-like serine proteases